MMRMRIIESLLNKNTANRHQRPPLNNSSSWRRRRIKSSHQFHILSQRQRLMMAVKAVWTSRFSRRYLPGWTSLIKEFARLKNPKSLLGILRFLKRLRILRMQRILRIQRILKRLRILKRQSLTNLCK